MPLSELLTLLGIIAAGVGALWGAIQWLISRMDNLNADIHLRINTMTNKTEFDKHVEHMEKQISSVRDDIRLSKDAFASELRLLSSNISTRLDNIMLAIRKEQ